MRFCGPRVLNQQERLVRELIDNPTVSFSLDSKEAVSRFHKVRQVTESLVCSLSAEDCMVQSSPEVSPTKWHLAHTSWFFETFVLSEANPKYRPYRAEFASLFNSYYETVGSVPPKSDRHLLSRPKLSEIMEYRKHVSRGITDLLKTLEARSSLFPIVELGIQHEQQHQELILMDIKNVFAKNPLRPSYTNALPKAPTAPVAWDRHWINYSAGLKDIGHSGEGFVFDNECPRHPVYLPAFALASHLVTNGEYLEFMESGGYQHCELWLSEGWATIKSQRWQSPLYWERGSTSDWKVMTLSGLSPLDENEPVCHVSYYEADAFARWAGKRLPTEQEWETAVPLDRRVLCSGNFLESGNFHPKAYDRNYDSSHETPQQMWGDVWEWTSSPYIPYPGFQPSKGSLGEYNGKFMCNQMVLRGGCAVTPQSHIRACYRNFYPPASRWQFSGIRLAEDA